jgi:putative ABC transport system substrate-binding protein
MTDRRRFVGALALGMLFPPSRSRAQAKGRVARIGVLRPAPDDALFRRNFAPFREALREKGFQEGTNLAIEYRVRPGSPGEMAALAAELVRLKLDAILAIAPAGVNATARATASIPIVAVDLESDPVGAGFAVGLPRPGKNVTGLFLDFPELGGKWIELLKAAVPRLAKVAVLWDPTTGPSLMRGAESAAPTLRARILPLEARSPDDFAEAFKSAVAAQADAMLILSSPVFNSARRQIVELTMKHRLPALMPFPGFAEDGGLMAYGPHVEDMFRQAGYVMAKILAGMPPGNIPIERPARFELIINLRTAKALGVAFPPHIVARADRILE